MRTAIVAIAAMLFSSAVLADDYVNPYTKKDGTFVQGHFKTEANSTKFDNYSTQGNTNPYTGKAGTVNPYGNTYGSAYGSSNSSSKKANCWGAAYCQ